MLNYKYVARDPATGQKVKSVIQADNEQSAAKMIRQQGLAPIDITAGASTTGLGKFVNRVHAKDKILFSRQLSTLINAGLPLVQSLRTVSNQAQNKALKVVVNRVIGDVESGSALSNAMARHPEVFNQIYVSLIAAGEASGTLDAALERLASQQEKDAEIMSKVRGAMVYPAIVLLVMFGVMGFMLVKVLPQVQVLYEGMGSAGDLPLITRLLIGLSSVLIKYWWGALLFLGVCVFFASRWFKTLGGRNFIDKAKMRAWPVGPLFMKLYMARFARTGTTLVASGVPLIQMLEITANAIDNVHIEASIQQAIEKVKGGKALSDSLQGDSNFLQLVPDMLKIGEQSGSLEQMLSRVADYYEKEVDTQIRTISTIIEPLLMVILGIFAFVIVAAVLLPIYGMAGKSIIH